MRTSRMWWIGLLLIVLGLSACSENSDGIPPFDQKMIDYEASLRAEADWLWENMTAARTQALPDSERCKPRTFTHDPIEVTDTIRKTDDVAAKTGDHLIYAAELIGQAHAEWEQYCDGRLSGGSTAVYMESRLRPAYNSLNVVNDTMYKRTHPNR